IQKASEVVKNGIPETKYRTWFYNDPIALARLANSGVDLIAIDTELDPWIVSITTEDEVHVFEWDSRFREPLTKLLTNERVMKVAHHWLYDYAFIRKCLGIKVAKPMFDTLGGAFILNTALPKELSPHISTRFTNWPYHKWLSNINQLHYCGMDGVVCYDSYWPIMKHMSDRGLMNVSTHDHRLLTPLLEMQAKGFQIDESKRVVVESELAAEMDAINFELSEMVEPIVDKKLHRFQKPHLFRVDRKCDCCGGGKNQRQHCATCYTGHPERSYKENVRIVAELNDMTQKAVIASWGPCAICHGSGKIVKNLPFNSDSPDQLADIVYRGLGIRPRKFKGKETIKAAQLEPLKDKYEVVAKIIQVSSLRSDLDTVARLRAGDDGLLHCEFDPWGTGSGRVAGKEGLLEAGTNPMNLPKEARRFVVPRAGYTFLYPDMAQVEARAMAVLSKDKNLRRALYENIPDIGKPDYHTWLLRAISECDPRIQLSRDQSKRVSYAGFYGARPEQLAKELTAEAIRKGKGMIVDVQMATTILEVLYRVCPEIKRWQDSVVEEVLRTRKLKNPYTQREFTWLGYIVDRKNKGELDYEIKKQVWSRLPQDIGAYVLGLGLNELYYESGEWGKLVTPLIHVHDALLIEAPIARVDEAEALAVKALSRYIWEMDFPAEMKRGDNWYEAS
ncbi:MAG TPA: DNA polymerase, partial [Saprospiraceae bacterium]|nr:DNA polymerase [Saprospiraceae bacterium]